MHQERKRKSKRKVFPWGPSENRHQGKGRRSLENGTGSEGFKRNQKETLPYGAVNTLEGEETGLRKRFYTRKKKTYTKRVRSKKGPLRLWSEKRFQSQGCDDSRWGTKRDFQTAAGNRWPANEGGGRETKLAFILADKSGFEGWSDKKKL